MADTAGRENIRLRWPVGSVLRQGGGYVVRSLTGESVEADAVVVAVPVSVVGAIEIDGLDPRTRAAFERIGFGRASKLHLTVESPCAPGIRQELDTPFSTWATAGVDMEDAAFVTGFAALFCFRLMLGAAESVAYPSYSKILATRFPKNRLGLTNATFESRNLAQLDKHEAYDVITVFDAIHDQAQPARVLENIYRALRPGGVFLMADIKASSRLEENVDVPMSTYLYTVSLMHCMTVSLALDGAGLGAAWGTQLATSMLGDAGFDDVRVAEVESDPINSYYIARK